MDGLKTQLGKRLLSSAGLLTVTISTIFIAPSWLFFAVVEGISLVALHEYLTIVQKKGINVPRTLGLVFGGLVPFFIQGQSVSLILAAAVLVFLILYFRPELKNHALVSISVTVFGIIYVSWFMAHLIAIRRLDQGAWWVFYIILLVKGGDAGAYFVGRKFGKIKLIEHISPNKSVEGAVAGLVTSFLLSAISIIYLEDVSLLHLTVLGISMGILAQLGDLGESVLKRDIGVKDSGVIPGLGGMLDVLDSLLLTIPFLYYYLVFILGAS